MNQSADKPDISGEIVVNQFDSPLGVIILSAQNDAITGIWFEGQKHFNGVQDTWRHEPNDPILKQAQAQLGQYFAGNLLEFDLPLAPHGTPFQKKVWKALLSIPFAGVVTYGAVARQVGAATGVRAVAAAIGRNPVSVIIPCHRVVGANGKLTGYAGGLDRKRHLLALEEEQHALL